MFVPIVLDSHASLPQIIHERVVQKESWDISLQQTAKQQLSSMRKKQLDRDWKLNDFFETIVVINLPHYKERRRKVKEELRGTNTKKFTIFEAINGRKDLPPCIWQKLHENLHNIDTSTPEGLLAFDRLHQGQAGCYMSHYKVIQMVQRRFQRSLDELKVARAARDEKAVKQALAKVRKYSRVLILEDDGGFGMVDAKLRVSKKGAGQTLRKALSTLPDNWDMLYFIVHASEPVKKISPHLCQIKRSWSAVAYAVNYRMYDTLIDHLKKIEDPSITHIRPVDNEIGEIHHLHNVYAIYPAIVFTQAGLSSITSKTWDLWQDHSIQEQMSKK